MSYDERRLAFSDDIEKFAQGDISGAEGLLRLAGEGAGVVNDAIGAVTEPLIPEIVKEGLGHVMQAAMDTGPAKVFMAWAKEHPEAARNLTAAANIGSMMAFKGVGKTGENAVKAVAHNAANKLEGFYGSGLVGKLGAVAKAGPSSVAHAAKDMFTPQGVASLDDGISSRLKSVAKDTVEGKDTPDWFVGQIEQSSQLGHGMGHNMPAIDDIYRPVGELGPTGPLSGQHLQQGVTNYIPRDVDPGLLNKAADRIKNAWGAKGDAVVINRNPRALTDTVGEATVSKTSSKTARALYAGAKAQRQAGKQGFDSLDDMIDFALLKDLNNATLVKKVNTGASNARGSIYEYSPMTKADKLKVKMTGTRGKYVPTESGLDNIRNYYKFKGAIKEGPKFTAKEEARITKLLQQEASGSLKDTGKKQLARFRERMEYGDLTPTQVKKYKAMRKRLDASKERRLKNGTLEVDAEGRVWIQDSHTSSAKSLGGVNDQFVITRDGKVHHFLSDETDLFGAKPPGMKTTINVTPPTSYDIFRETPKIKDTTQRAMKQAHAEGLLERLGAPVRNATPEGMATQMADAVTRYRPSVGPQDYLSVGRNVTHATLPWIQGLLSED